MLLPFFMVIVVQMKRMATQSHVFAYCYLTAAVSGATMFALADIFFLVAAFRPGAQPGARACCSTTWPGSSSSHPSAWLVAMNLLLAVAVYFDDGPQPGIPAVGRLLLTRHRGLRWRPAAGAAIFRSGPLAWDGAVSFWLRNGAFALFVLVMFFVLRPAIASAGRRGRGRAVSNAVTVSRHRRVRRLTAPAARGQARRLDRVLDRARVLHRVRVDLFRAGAGDAAPAAGRQRPLRWSTSSTTHSTTIQIGFGILVLIVGGAGIANGIVMLPHETHVRRARCSPTPTWARLASGRCRVACWSRSVS